MQSEDFAARLTRMMNERNVGVPDLVESLGGLVTRRTVERWRSGATAPGIEALPFLARALDTTPNALMGWEEAKA